MEIKPLGSNVLIKPKEQSTSSIAGLYLPEDEAYHAVEGEVVAVGDQVIYLEGGEWVYFRMHAPDEVEIDGQKLLVVEEEDVLLIKEN